MALRNNPYLPLYVQDFMTDEKLIECSAEATGVYIRLLCLMHKSEQYGVILLKQKYKQSENQIKNFALQLSKFFPYDYATIERGIMELAEEKVIELGNDLIMQKRMIKDNEISEKRSTAGRNGGVSTQSKKEKNKKIDKDFDKAKNKANTDIENDIENEYKIVNNNSSNNIKKIEFSVFWDLYDKKVGDKSGCKKKWDKLSLDTQNKIIDTLPSFKSKIEDKKYQPHPATYLNQERWNDETITSAKVELKPGETEEERFHREWKAKNKVIPLH